VIIMAAIFGANEIAGIYGIAIAVMAQLSLTGLIVALDAFGPITDNAGGIAEMADLPEDVRNVTDPLDAVGNTTKAVTKGYAIGSAALAALVLFAAFKIELQEELGKPVLFAIDDPEVLIGLLIGGLMVCLFAALSMEAVGRAGGAVVEEVRRQFREHPGIMDYSQRPDYARVVDITTRAALREMIAPGLVAVATPIVVGLLLGAEAVAGLLMVGTIAGVMLATVLNNGGGAWDNAKKYIESGQLKDDQGNVLGKGSDAHAAAVVGDTVGDPFKDTAGPSLHVLVKLLATITLVLAPLFIR
jgi:K(+)-stimulated pyrophosphate-energized sodium pump